MALWKQPRQQPFTTYRDPETGQWIVVKPSQPIQDIFVEAPLYRDPQTGHWITIKPTLPPQNTLVADTV
jgi:hypothetical protein